MKHMHRLFFPLLSVGAGRCLRLVCCLVFAVMLFSGCGKSPISIPAPASLPGKGSAQQGSIPNATVKNKVVSSARSQIGVPYRWGGQAPGGFDCSGLVMWAYKQQGITVPRTTSEQTRAGRRVERKAMQPGDIVVFRTQSGLHTGIYTGRGTFIHSPKPGERVREDPLANSYWNRAYREARRLL